MPNKNGLRRLTGYVSFIIQRDSFVQIIVCSPSDVIYQNCDIAFININVTYNRLSLFPLMLSIFSYKSY